jgi:hypothetical protein
MHSNTNSRDKLPMTVKIDIWLRGTEVGQSGTIEGIAREPSAWTDEDVRRVLEGMLSTMHRLKHPEEAATVSLRGLSWIVNPFEQGGVVIAIEVGMGAAVAGPLEVDQRTLEAAITRVLAQATRPAVGQPPGPTVH